jgi:hypothetical protein
MKKLIILIIPILLLCGCNNKKCIKSHKEESTCTWHQYIRVGKVTTMIPHHYACEIEVCDEYEDINGNKGE